MRSRRRKGGTGKRKAEPEDIFENSILEVEESQKEERQNEMSQTIGISNNHSSERKPMVCVEIDTLPSREGQAEELSPASPPASLPLLRAPSTGRVTRGNTGKGITSCRQLVILIVATDVADEIYTFIYGKQNVDLGKKRIILSKIWRQTLEKNGHLYPKLYNFFALNGTSMVDRVILESVENVTEKGIGVYVTGSPSEYLPGIATPHVFTFDAVTQIYPMAVTNPEGTHVLHYFTIILTEGRIFIYTAYGSDYLRAHPERIEITFKELDDFIQAGRTPSANSSKDNLDKLFKKFFTQNCDKVVRYLDEKYDKAKCKSISAKIGIELEIGFYSLGYHVMYFPTIKDDLREASRAEVDKIKGTETDEQQKENLLAWIHQTGGTKKRSNRRITRRNIRKRYTSK